MAGISVIHIICFLFCYDLVTIEFLSSSVYTLSRYIALLPVILYCISKIRVIWKSEWGIIFLLTGLACCIAVSAYVNKVQSFYLRAAVYYGALVIVIFLFPLVLGYMGKLEVLFKTLRAYLFSVLFINDLLMVVLPERFYNIDGRKIGTCFLGNKFSVAYIHLMFVFLIVMLENRKRVRQYKVIFCTIFMSLFCLYIECATVLITIWIFCLLYFMVPCIKRVLSKTPIFFIFFFIAAVFVVWFDRIIALPPVQYIIVNILRRDVTLTGRSEVYSYIFPILDSHEWLGYGYGTSIFRDTTTWYGNAQNAFWDFVIRYGLVTMGVLVILLAVIVRRYCKISRGEQEIPTLWLGFIMLYLYLFMGIVEIVYEQRFLFYLAILNGLCVEWKCGKQSAHNRKAVCG